MFSDSQIPRETIQAYLETEYIVFDDASTTLRVGRANPQLVALHKAHGVACSAFITAWNPFSQTCSAEFNADRQQALARELAQLGHVVIEGIGKHPSNNWPGEASFLVLGLSLDAAKSLGTRYGQNAIVWSTDDATPQLVLLR
ncbi:DUF3293 domain-containing protein [Paraburkholderia azotifigens]|uniref:DUF3293 domain-containing protein n=1 Tax=Paraburkholderia azotifigens TaxID=2057004 RepID=A0A5C6VAD9_9BURK|nr:DUF3293 domain-containing protein [Paraburkholderia azotifigens]TXC81276.1 DUF3293 domain-containing protein [Paraburkholderia azotifigens]